MKKRCNFGGDFGKTRKNTFFCKIYFFYFLAPIPTFFQKKKKKVKKTRKNTKKHEKTRFFGSIFATTNHTNLEKT